MIGLLLVAITVQLEARDKPAGISTGAQVDLAELEFREGCFFFRSEISTIYVQPSVTSAEYFTLSVPGYLPHAGAAGQPALPSRSVLFEYGAQEDAVIRITVLDSVVIDLGRHGINGKVVPFQPSVRKGREKGTPSGDDHICERDAWIGSPLISIEPGGVLRGIPVSTLHFCPVRYNPSRHQVTIYHHVEAVIGPVEPSGGREVPSPAFESVFRRIVRQREDRVRKAVYAEEPMTMVILSDTMFRQTLQPLIRWKAEKGFRVVEAYMQEAKVGGTRESIRNYLKGIYTAPPPGIAPTTYLLIVGDVEQVPLSQSSGEITDLYYTTYDGTGDYIPDVFYGRISVAQPAQLQAVLDKIMEYEQYRFPDPSFLDEAVLIAGVDGTFAARHGNGQINYASKLYFNADNGINAHVFLYPESDTSDRQILELISRGSGFVNYTGHGLYDRWINPAFHQEDIAGLMNTGKYPVMIGNGCETNIYTLGECFAEALVRTPSKGALAYIGCTSDSYWDEDYYWSVGVGAVVPDPRYEETSLGFYDRVFHLHGETRDSWTPSLGEMIFGGNMAVQESHSSLKKFYWEIYQLMGDPSLVPWFGRPGMREVQFPGILPPGSERFDISCAPFDYVALSRNGQLLDAAHCGREGFVTLQLSDTSPGDTLDLVVTGDRYRPFRGKVVTGLPEQPFLDLTGYGLSDESGEKDSMVSHGESFSLDLDLVNRGAGMTRADTLILRAFHPGITVTDSLVSLPPLASGEPVELKGAFGISTSTTVCDQESFALVLQLKGDPSGHRLLLKETVHAPILVSGGIRWDDRPWGNGNGIAEGGELLLFEWTLTNRGHFRTGSITGAVTGNGASVFGACNFPSSPSLDAGDQCTYHFVASLSAIREGEQVRGSFLAGDGYTTAGDSVTLVPGRHFEDFSRDVPGRYPFIRDTLSAWRTDSGTFASSPFALRSGPVPDLGSSLLAIRFETGRPDTLSFSFRVSSEAGYDFLEFHVDSAEIRRWSGEREWERVEHVLGPGDHRIEWCYRKDQSISKGADAAWVDDVIFPSSAFRIRDLSLMDMPEPESGPWLTGSEGAALRIRNTGNDTITECYTRILVEGSAAEEDTFMLSLLPGQEVILRPEATLDLSRLGIYTIRTGVSAPGDRYPGNDALVHRVSHDVYPDLGLSLVEIDSVEGVYADAVVALANVGNIPIDSIRYEVFIDGERTDSGVRPAGLEPGEEVLSPFRLMDSLEGRYHTGIHTFLIRSVQPDSATGNDRVEGSLYWHALGTGPVRTADGLSVYPNPATEGFSLVLDEPAAEEMVVLLFHSTGMPVLSVVIRKGEQQLYLGENLPPGHYLLHCPGMGMVIHLVRIE